MTNTASWGSTAPEFNEGTQQDQLTERFESARYAASAPGGACQVLGVIAIALGGLVALMGGPSSVGAAAASIGGGASLGALGSIASNTKKAAALAELQAWVVVQNAKEVQ